MRNKTYSLFIMFSYISIIIFAYSLKFISKYTIGDEILINYQLEKIEKNRESTQNIFLGDSSLGHSINASIIEKITNKNTLNLALWADISFSGSYSILKNYKFEKLENIYVLASLDSWRKNPTDYGYQLIESQKNPFTKYFLVMEKNFNFKKFYTVIGMLFFSDKYPEIKDDYLERENQIVTIKEFKQINKNKFAYLEKIFKYCKVNDLNCKFFHTPIVKYHCENQQSKKYIEEINNLLKLKNIIFEKNLYCFNKEEFSDSMDHLNARKKIDFSNIFGKLIIKN